MKKGKENTILHEKLKSNYYEIANENEEMLTKIQQLEDEIEKCNK